MNRSLGECFTSEAQAIGIYEAEHFWMRFQIKGRRRTQLFQLMESILAEERGHLDGLDPWRRELGRGWSSAISLNRVLGWCIGSLLAWLPSIWISKFHKMGERAASEIYQNASEACRQCDSTLQGVLILAAEQERRHIRQFNDFLDQRLWN